MFYSKTGDYVWNRPYDPWDEDKMLREYPYVTEDGRRYKKVPIHAPGCVMVQPVESGRG